ncbi:MAG: DUF4339 domain-containing protein [Planctomycetes bacterium]|nr:DUF4339 domain-containing protein [Planctomycetota bacterium]MBU4398591.1 DUF4339 domain-containing protein [Planctomycetota bacterium]
MNPVEWYYARDNKQAGPVSAVDLKQLAAAGQLRPDDLVWREGMTEWSAARNVRGLFEESAAPAPAGSPPEAVAPTPAVSAAPQVPAAPMRHPFDSLMDWFRPRFDARLVDSIARFFRTCGSYGLLVAIVLGAAFSVIMAFKADPVGSLLSGAIMLVVLVVLQYVAGKFCDALDRLNLATAGSLPSTLIPDGLALLSKALGVAVLLSSIIAAVQISAYAALPFGIAAFLVLCYLSLVAMNPATLNYSIGAQSGAGEEAIGAVTFLFKALMRLVPVAFGSGVVCGVLLLGFACYLPFSGEGGLSVAQITWKTAVYGLIFSALLPPAAYLIFLLYSLLHDLCRAILVLPSKLDTPAGKDADEVDGDEE